MEHLEVFTPPKAPSGVALKGLAVVTCMDSRVDPYSMLGMHRGDLKILRNAGGRVTEDVLRTLVAACYLLGVHRVLVIAHTDCLMTSGTDEELHAAVSQHGGPDTQSLDFNAVKISPEATLAEDVTKIRSFPLLPDELIVGGAIYDVDTGRLTTYDL